MSLIPTLQARSHGGEVGLHAFPSLAFAPQQHGPGIRLASTGRPIEEVMAKIRSRQFELACEETAKELGVTVDELFDVVRYFRQNPGG